MKLTFILFAFFINFFNTYFLKAEEIISSSTNQIENTFKEESEVKKIHIVEVGDTITSISKFYAIEKELIIRLNNLKDENYIYVGQNLKISSPSQEIRNEEEMNNYHVVQEGESLTEISNKYNLNFKYLIEINNIKEPDSLEVGSKLFLRNKNMTNHRISTVIKDEESKGLASADYKNYGPIKTQQVELEYVGGRKILNVLNQRDKKLIISIDCESKNLDVRIPFRKWKGWKPAEEEFEKKLINDFC